MTLLLDVVNFNADASCLAAPDWLAVLKGGSQSRMCAWLRSYVELRRKVVLGIVGSTVADLRAFNPEAIAIINAHPDLFEIIVRPFSHDVALLRSPAGFAQNLALGKRILERTFGRVTPFYLPAEFMLSNSQVLQAARAGIQGLFINADRFAPIVQRSIPVSPYIVKGVLGVSLSCLPLRGALTRAYLASLHSWSADPWNQALAPGHDVLLGSWRDGESWLFLPDGEARERTWLQQESTHIHRSFVREVVEVHAFMEPDCTQPHGWWYPVHSFADWFKESRMLGYLQRVQAIESRLASFNALQLALWLQAINSDVLSSVEKDSPSIRIVDSPGGDAHGREWTIRRSARGFEGEEYLSLLEHVGSDFDVAGFIHKSSAAHIEKLRARLAFIESI
jgi:hypothetical protein